MVFILRLLWTLMAKNFVKRTTNGECASYIRKYYNSYLSVAKYYRMTLFIWNQVKNIKYSSKMAHIILRLSATKFKQLQ